MKFHVWLLIHFNFGYSQVEVTDPLHEDLCTFILSDCYCFFFFETTWVLFDFQAEARKAFNDLNITVEHY